jgi:3-deoxy-D-manno-octulosonic-acid transferase
MYGLYSFAYALFRSILWVVSFFDSKVRAGLKGRKNIQREIEEHYSTVAKERKRILIHVASFGELEQAKPVIAKLKEHFPNCHIHLTFFSPSGYQNAKGRYLMPDIITYSPIDTRSSVNALLDIVQPDLALFVRYDIWFNMARELVNRRIPSILFSATYSDRGLKNYPILQILYRRTYQRLNHIFTIGENDATALVKLGIDKEKITVAGDTRSDQVLTRRQDSEQKSDIAPESFLLELRKPNVRTLVAGSTWEADEEVILPAILESINDLKVIIVPHEITKEHLMSLLMKCNNKAILSSDIAKYNSEPILIWDKIGDLFSLYHYADVAYVGGGFGDGVHNVLEPAVWGVPSIVGPNHERSQEIAELIERGGVKEIQNKNDFTETLGQLLNDKEKWQWASNVMSDYIRENTGATEKVTGRIERLNIL